jgi:glycine/D-amino acid oxidase-like deaminating enzyme
MTLSRRRLIHQVGRLGGVAAAYRTMAAMGLLPIPQAYAGPPPLPPGNGRRIVIIGAGIAGMVLAWELRKAGYAPLMLEARPRAGGRNWSLRGGDEIREAASVQRIAWDAGPHMYLNPGPARLPYHHEGILSSCRRPGIPLEVMSNHHRRPLAVRRGIRRQVATQPQVVNDIRGYVAELVAKALDRDALAEAVTTEDKERVGAAAQLRRARCGHVLQRFVPRRLCGASRGHSGRHAQPAARSAPDPRCRVLAVPEQFRRKLAPGGDDDAAGRRHGPYRRGLRGQTRQHKHLSRRTPRTEPHR